VPPDHFFYFRKRLHTTSNEKTTGLLNGYNPNNDDAVKVVLWSVPGLYSLVRKTR
jgi:hypothetical protein